MMTMRQAQNVAELLRREPLYYRNFGVWWWAVKAQLKAVGISREQLACLGDYDDPPCQRYYEDLSPSEVWDEALRAQLENATGNRNSAWTTAPDGETYHLYDGDVE